MFFNKTKWLALLGGAVLLAAPAVAQESKAIIDALVKKGVISSDEAKEILAEAKKATPVVAVPGARPVTRLSVGGRLQIQYAGLDTDIANTNNDPANTNHFFLRRIYFGARASLGPKWSANMTYDFARDGFDAALVQWKDGDISVDVGLRKVNLGYEERTSGASLKSIERSAATRYFVEENNGRRLGAGAHRVGVFVDGKQGDFFYGAAVTNPERALNFSVASGAGSGGNNSPAFWANGGYNGKFNKDGKFVIGGGLGVLPDQGGKNPGTGWDMTVYTFYADITSGNFNLAAEFMGSDVERGASATVDAKPTAFWIQPSYKLSKNVELAFRYSYVDSDGRGINVSDGIRSAPSGGTHDKLTEMYLGATWFIIGNDLKLQAGIVSGKSEDTLAGGFAEAKVLGFRSQLQLQF
jgi:phosphate-selective porin